MNTKEQIECKQLSNNCPDEMQIERVQRVGQREHHKSHRLQQTYSTYHQFDDRIIPMMTIDFLTTSPSRHSQFTMLPFPRNKPYSAKIRSSKIIHQNNTAQSWQSILEEVNKSKGWSWSKTLSSNTSQNPGCYSGALSCVMSISSLLDIRTSFYSNWGCRSCHLSKINGIVVSNTVQYKLQANTNSNHIELLKAMS